MSKRRVDEEESDIDVSSTDSENEELGEENEEMVNVDFDYFDLNPEVDFHATKNFIRQLLGDDGEMFDLSSLADLILTKNSVGTTIKTDGIEGDPFAILSVINLNANRANKSVKKIADYMLEKTSKKTEFNLTLRQLLSADKFKVGLIISERMINMPVEVVPPMYKMLLEEMQKAEDSHEKYEFDYFIIISKIYKLVSPNIEEKDDSQKRKKKKKAEVSQVEMDYFHYEDIVFEENSMYHGHFDYTNIKQDTDARRVFTDYGIDPKLSIILIDKAKMAKSVIEMEEKFPPF